MWIEKVRKKNWILDHLGHTNIIYTFLEFQGLNQPIAHLPALNLPSSLPHHYPQYPWHKSPHPGKNSNAYWNSLNQRNFMEKISRDLNLNTIQHLHTLNHASFINSGGGTLLKLNNNSLSSYLLSIYPEFNSKFTELLPPTKIHTRLSLDGKIQRSPEGPQQAVPSREVCRAYPELPLPGPCKEEQVRYEGFVVALNGRWEVGTVRELNGVTAGMVLEAGGKWILCKFNGSVLEFLKASCVQFNINPLERRSLQQRRWEVLELKGEVSSRLQWWLEIEKKEDWYRVSNFQIGEALQRVVPRGRIREAIQGCFPEEDWDPHKLALKNKKAIQRWLFLKIKEIFPNQPVLEEYTSDLLRQSGHPLRFDIYLPSQRLAFEYHGEQHYGEFTKKGFSSQQEKIRRDKEKIEECIKNKITLVVVPFWWDLTKETLLSSLRSLLPTLPSHPRSSPVIPNFLRINSHHFQYK